MILGDMPVQSILIYHIKISIFSMIEQKGRQLIWLIYRSDPQSILERLTTYPSERDDRTVI